MFKTGLGTAGNALLARLSAPPQLFESLEGWSISRANHPAFNRSNLLRTYYLMRTQFLSRAFRHSGNENQFVDLAAKSSSFILHSGHRKVPIEEVWDLAVDFVRCWSEEANCFWRTLFANGWNNGICG